MKAVRRMDPGTDAARLPELVARYQSAAVRELDNRVASDPLVSVIVPTYQHARYLAECLDSILRQDCTDPVEILVGDDDSTDGTRAICLDYAARYPDRIRLFLHQAANRRYINGLATGRFNLAFLLGRARGRFIAVCEGDDYWRDPAKLRKQLDALRAAPGAVLAFSDAIVIQDGQETGARFLAPTQRRDVAPEELATGTRIPTHAILFRNIFDDVPLPREFFDVFNGDSFLFSFLSGFGFAKYVDSVVPGAYRVHGGGMWTALGDERRLEMALDTKRILRRLHQGSPRVRNLLDQGIVRTTVSLAKLARARGDTRRAVFLAGRVLVLLLRRPHVHAALVANRLRNRLRDATGGNRP